MCLTESPEILEVKAMKKQSAEERICQMEEILDRASSVMAELEKNLSELESLQPDIQKLEAYYTGKD